MASAKPREFRNRDRSKVWKITVSVRPYKRVTKSHETAAAAREWHDALTRELKARRQRGHRDTNLTRLTLRRLADLYLEDPETAALGYHDDLSLLLAWWVNHYGATRVLSLGALTLREARDRLSRGRAAATVNRYLSAMRSCWNWGRAAELVPQELSWPSRLMLTEPRGRTRFLSDDELAALLKTATASPVMSAAILVSIGCGVRQSELLRLTWADIDFDKQRLRILLSKNNEARGVYLPTAVATALRTLKSAKVVGTQRIFLQDDGKPANKDWIEHRWRAIRTAAALKDFRWHDLRHSCASFLAQQGANLLEIGSVLGHKSPSVTRRYSHLIEGAPVTGHTKLDEKLRQS
jgi:integrase